MSIDWYSLKPSGIFRFFYLCPIHMQLCLYLTDLRLSLLLIRIH